MNAIIVSALLGVVMMFSGIFTTNKTIIKNIATVGVLVLLAANLMEMNNLFSFDINTHDLIVTQRYGLFFNCIAYGATFIYLLLSASDITEVGVNVAEYFALIFFVLCGVAILSSFNGLLMLFIGVEIVKDNSIQQDYQLAKYIKNELRNKHILVSTDGPFDSVIKTKPPLCFTKENAKTVVDAIDIVLEEYYSGLG